MANYVSVDSARPLFTHLRGATHVSLSPLAGFLITVALSAMGLSTQPAGLAFHVLDLAM